jgi:RNA polymerase sigma-70 factor (ECF subfamily)
LPPKAVANAELDAESSVTNPRFGDWSSGVNADRDLVVGLLARRGAAFQEVYARYRVPLFGFLVRLSRDRQLAEDLFQNTWFKLARSAPSLRLDTDLRAWLFTVARNEWRTHQRFSLLDFRRRARLQAESEEALVPDGVPDGLQVTERALAALSDGDRELLLLVGVDGLDQRRAAAVLGISEVALRKRLGRARARFEQRLKERHREA